MKSLAKLRRGVYPQPVYEAHFSDGTTQRMSFFSEKGKPIDTERGRRLINSLCRWSPAGLTRLSRECMRINGEWIDAPYTPVIRNSLAGKKMVRGVVEHQANGKIWRNVDPHFLPHAVETAKPKRITAKLAKDTLADLLDWLDGDGPDDALDRARELLAA